jgi:hypothetical protein
MRSRADELLVHGTTDLQSQPDRILVQLHRGVFCSSALLRGYTPPVSACSWSQRGYPAINRRLASGSPHDQLISGECYNVDLGRVPSQRLSFGITETVLLLPLMALSATPAVIWAPCVTAFDRHCSPNLIDSCGCCVRKDFDRAKVWMASSQ